MQRKVINISGNTMMVTLPSKWVTLKGVKKGDEIEIEEREDSLILKNITGKPSQEISSYTIDLKNTDRIGRRYITALYRKGVGEINFTYDDPVYFKSIQDTISEQTIGLEIMDQKANSCKIKDLLGYSSNEFHSVLRRCWLLIKQMSIDSYEAVLHKDYKTLESMHFRDRQVNKLTNYCVRQLLNNSKFSAYKTTIYFHFIRNLEEIGDQFQDFSVYLSKTKQNLAPTQTALYNEIIKMFDEFYSVFYSYDMIKMEELLISSKKIYSKVENISRGSDIDSMITHYFFSLTERIRRLLSSIIELHLENLEHN